MMRLTIERMRAGVMAGTLLLLTTLGGILLYAHYRQRGLLRELPSRLGMDIQKQTDGVTYSQTIKGRTVFTVHAARATQHRNGTAELEDAGVVLYGDGTGRADRIYGKHFHYDQAAGMLRALGQVQLDLEAPAPVSAEDRTRFASGGRVAGAKASGGANDGLEPVHVTTSDLVYSQRTGMAMTPEPLHFEYRGMVGDARGASYDAKTGFTVFERNIRLSGVKDGRAYQLTAAHGELDRAANRLTLRSALLETGGAGADAEKMTAAVLVLDLGPGGGVERVAGRDGVVIEASGSSAHAPTAELMLGAGNHPEEVRMHGGVQFAHEAGYAGGERTTGTAEECVGHFDERDELSTLLLSRKVLIDSVTGGDGGTRRLTGDKVLLGLARAPGVARSSVRQVTAEGSAELRVVRTGAAGGTDVLGGDVLEAQLQPGAGGRAQLKTVTGRGHVVLRRSAAGLEETSRAETMEASFGARGSGGGRTGVQLVSAVERGSVTLERTSTAANGAGETLRGSGREASYDGAARRTTLLGEAVLTRAADSVRADRIVMANDTGDAEAYGMVQATFSSSIGAGGAAASQEPVHAVAARAKFDHEADVVTLFGVGTQVARIWHGASQVEAPLLTLGQRAGTLDASGGRGVGLAMVKTVLAEEAARSDAEGATGQGARVARVESERLHYSDPERRAEFAGAVVMRSADGVLHAQRAVATMAAAGSSDKVTAAKRRASGDGAGGAGMLGGALERVVADGGIRLEQPGRVATGQQIVYTAVVGQFVLTGLPAAPPVVTDQVTGSVTGAVLRFYTGDNRVAIDGSALPGKAGRVHTELRLKQ